MSKNDLSKIEFIFPKLLQIWEKAPDARPASMTNVKKAHDLWEWCDERSMDFDDLETYLSMFIVEKMSKFFTICVTVKNGIQEVKNMDENISVSGFNIISSMSELVKVSDNILQIKESSIEVIKKTVLNSVK